MREIINDGPTCIVPWSADHGRAHMTSASPSPHRSPTTRAQGSRGRPAPGHTWRAVRPTSRALLARLPTTTPANLPRSSYVGDYLTPTSQARQSVGAALSHLSTPRQLTISRSRNPLCRLRLLMPTYFTYAPFRGSYGFVNSFPTT